MNDYSKIGSAIVIGDCALLVRISVFDVRTKKNREPSVEYHDLDITNKKQLDNALRQIRPQAIIHTASPPPLLTDLSLYLRVNVEGTRTLLQSAQEVGVKAFVYTSSASVVHDSVSDLVEADETLPLVYLPVQREYYTNSKALADQLVLDYNNSMDGRMLTACLRPSDVFGEGDGTALAFAENAASGKYKYQVGNGQNLFDFAYNGNVAYAHILLLQAPLRSHIKAPEGDMVVGGETFFITNDEHVSFWDLLDELGPLQGIPQIQRQQNLFPYSGTHNSRSCGMGGLDHLFGSKEIEDDYFGDQIQLHD
ncbi:hypothetical protein HYALB_00012079 [Hymenoscyphus albidus]|uniref:3-beta hydroxysteroid dehydrogenase/isomerase domain-containing protein n=1 Tax=Hymenoscyphus albidus TaxID=595503 RepID=A0A9N9LW16_9HELO|nr:hypothetical protein HYALB_00012079 [Hymenoscyphus albidus]